MQGSELKLCLEAPHVHHTPLRQPEDRSKVRPKGKTVSALEGESSCFKFYLSSLWKKAVQAVEVLLPMTHMILTHLPCLLTYLLIQLLTYLHAYYKWESLIILKKTIKGVFSFLILERVRLPLLVHIAVQFANIVIQRWCAGFLYLMRLTYHIISPSAWIWEL